MAYTKTPWKNDTEPYINAKNLNHIEDGIKDLEPITQANATNIASVTSRVGAVETKAATIKTTADNALATANAAKSTADNALSTANTAKDTADTAKATAIAAKENADTAKEIVTEGRDLASNLMAVNGVPSAQYAYSTLIVTSGFPNATDVAAKFGTVKTATGTAEASNKTFEQLTKYDKTDQTIMVNNEIVKDAYFAYRSSSTPKEVRVMYDKINVDMPNKRLSTSSWTYHVLEDNTVYSTALGGDSYRIVNEEEAVVVAKISDAPAGSSNAFQISKTFSQLTGFCHDKKATNPPKRVVLYFGEPLVVDMLYDPTNGDGNIHITWPQSIHFTDNPTLYSNNGIAIMPDNSNVGTSQVVGLYTLVPA